MKTNFERFQEKLAALESGKPIEECLEGLEPDQVELLQLASSLRGFKPPARKKEVVVAQLAVLTKLAGETQAASADLTATPENLSHSSRLSSPGEDNLMKRIINWPNNRWVVPVAASAVALVAVIAFVSLIALGFWWTGAVRAQSATLADVSGEVLMAPASADGEWRPVSDGSRLRPGQQLRVGADSAASLVFYEGSRVALNAGSQVTLEQLSGNWFKTLKVVLVQEAGTTQHSVVPLRGSRSHYRVITPSGIASVHGTSFSVALDEGGYARFSVDTGEVLVQRETSEVTLTAGQAAVAQSDASTLDAAYQFTLIGLLTGMDPDGWSVNGVTFKVTPDTRIIGEPQVDLQVFVEGRIVNDERIADRVLVLTDGQTQSSFTGILESIGDQTWRVGGEEVQISPQTQLVGDPQEGIL
jgi:hypothetical protein